MAPMGLVSVAAVVAMASVAWGGDPAKARVDQVPRLLILNPHEEPARCPSCHNRVPDPAEARALQFQLRAPSIDETCAMCHPALCCEPSVKHANHPTGIDRWKDPKFRKPLNLPLYQGFITCSTCHFHRERDGKREMGMLRIVAVGPDGKPDWAGLCRDCHADY